MTETNKEKFAKQYGWESFLNSTRTHPDVSSLFEFILIILLVILALLLLIVNFEKGDESE